jgi:LysM repeat protein
MSYSRSPARWLGPLAILAALAAIFAIVSATTGDDSGSTPKQASTEERRGNAKKKTSTNGDGGKKTSTTPTSGKKTYTVKPGDTLAGIAETTGVPIAELLELNPGVDSNSLSIGQELRLAR